MSDIPFAYSVLGGCTTRDAAEIGRDPLPRPVRYFSRTRIQSIVSAPSPIDESAIALESKFQRRVVLQDHDKTVARVLSAIDHPLVMDLLGERFGLVHTGRGIITASNYYLQADLSSGRATPVADDRALESDGPFAEAVRAFAALLPQQPVIVHRAFWAVTDLQGKRLPNPTRAKRANEWLARAYDLLEVALGDRALPVEVPAEYRIADPGHKWGASAFHYSDPYYDQLAAEIRAHLPVRAGA